MAGNIPTEDDWVDDKSQRQHSVPAANLQEVWPIAHIAAYREIAAPLAALHDQLRAGSGLSTSPSSIQRQIMDLIERINDLTQQRWAEYVRAAAAHPIHADSLKAAGVPEHITYDPKSGIPFLTWLTVMEGPTLNWRPLTINIVEDKSGQPLVMTPPFRPVRIDSLPPGTQRINISDPMHAAALAMFEVMECAYVDLTRAKASVSSKDNWVRMRCIANFYTAIVQERMKELALDDYRGWVSTLPENIPISDAPAVIARHGSNAVVIQVLALRTVSAFLHDCMERTESEPSNVDQGAMVDQVLQEMGAYLERFRARANSLNSLLIGENVADPSAFVAQVVSRPVPRSVPLIAMVPRDGTPAQTANVAELRRD